MPKFVDHDARRAQIARATWALVAREGVAALSVRNVATESGLSVGSLRAAFPSNIELIEYCVELIGQRARARINRIIRMPPVSIYLRKFLDEFLPIDDERHLEMRFMIDLASLAAGEPRLKRSLDQWKSEMDAVFLSLLTDLVGHCEARPDLDVALEARRLYALLDGLALHMLWQQPNPQIAETAAVLDAHVASLLR